MTDRNIFKSSSVTFSNLWEMLLGNIHLALWQLNFWKSSEIFREWSDKSGKSPNVVVLQIFYIINKKKITWPCRYEIYLLYLLLKFQLSKTIFLFININLVKTMFKEPHKPKKENLDTACLAQTGSASTTVSLQVSDL